jgi:hypothetical protein
MTKSSTSLNFNQVFKFWLPLAATWLMMAFEGFLLAVILARLPEPKINLAAYGVVNSFLLLFGSPVFMMMSASTVHVTGRNSYYKLLNFTSLLNGIVLAIMLVFIVPHLFNFITMGLIGLPNNIAHMVFVSIIIFLPWPTAVGYRRFYQGILIRNNRTNLVAMCTIIRVSTLIVTALILARLSNLKGVYVVSIAFTTGVLIELLASRLMVNKIVRRLINDTRLTVDTDHTYQWIFRFYFPLALTSILSIGSYPLLTFFMGQSKFAIESLAVYPVISSLAFIFSCISFSYVEVVIALMGKDPGAFHLLRKCAIFVGIILTALLALLTFTPLSRLWFQYVSGLSIELTEFAMAPARIITLLPGLTMVMSFQRAVLMLSGNTRPITGATISEAIAIIVIMFFSVYYLDLVGAIAATSALLIGRICSNGYLVKPYMTTAKEMTNKKDISAFSSDEGGI